MEKSWTEVAPTASIKKKKKRKPKLDTHAAYMKRLEKVLPDDELREIGRNFGTKRKPVDYDNICRVVPGDWIDSPQLLEMNKENRIYPETIIKEMYQQIRAKVTKRKS